MDNFGLNPTNTMALSSFDVLKMDAVEDPLINMNRLATLDLEESYMADAVDFIKETHQEFTNAKRELYQSISESTTQVAMLESFGGFFVKVRDIIEKFLKFIKSLFQRFITSLMQLVHSDKHITKNKKKFDDFKEADNFDIDGYNYTIKQDVPVANAILDISKVFEDLKLGIGGNISTRTVKDSINLENEPLYDRFRAAVLNKEGVIYASEFSDELYKVYRDDEMDTDKIEIDRAAVKQALDRFLNYKKYKSAVEHDNAQIEKAYKQLENEVKEITKRNGDLNVSAFLNRIPDSAGVKGVDTSDTNSGLTMSGDLMVQIDLYVKNKVDIIQECSNIHTLAFASKLDAMKSCYKQDRAILYGALNKVQRTENARKEK